MGKTAKAQGRIPAEMDAAIREIAEDRYDGNYSNALAFVLAVGLSEVLERDFDTGIDDKPSEDDVAPFRDYLITDHGYKPRTATISASVLRAAFRSGDIVGYIEGHHDPKVRTNREGIWRLWTEYCLVNDLNPFNVRVAGLRAAS